MIKKASVAIGAAAFAAAGITALISDNLLTVSEYRVGTGRLRAPLCPNGKKGSPHPHIFC